MASGPSPAPGEPCQAAIGSEACPFNRAGGLLFQGAQGEQENKRQISLSLGKKKKRSISLKTQHKTRSKGSNSKEGLWGPEYSRAAFAQLRVLGDAGGNEGWKKNALPTWQFLSGGTPFHSLANPVAPGHQGKGGQWKSYGERRALAWGPGPEIHPNQAVLGAVWFWVGDLTSLSHP